MMGRNSTRFPARQGQRQRDAMERWTMTDSGEPGLRGAEGSSAGMDASTVEFVCLA